MLFSTRELEVKPELEMAPESEGDKVHARTGPIQGKSMVSSV